MFLEEKKGGLHLQKSIAERTKTPVAKKETRWEAKTLSRSQREFPFYVEKVRVCVCARAHVCVSGRRLRQGQPCDFQASDLKDAHRISNICFLITPLQTICLTEAPQCWLPVERGGRG